MKGDWIKIESHSNYYVNSKGEVINSNSGKILKPGKNNWGYSLVSLWNNRKLKSFYVHRLVAIAFIPNPENKPEVNHIDGNVSNNKASNLEWVTRSENMLHAIDTGLLKVRGMDSPTRKLNDTQVLEIIEHYKNGLSYAKISVIYGVSSSLIGGIVSGKVWRSVNRNPIKKGSK